MIEYICSFEEEFGFLVSASIKYVEELIRCEDCKHYTALDKNGLWGRCLLHASRVETARPCQSVDYCSWAERKKYEPNG